MGVIPIANALATGSPGLGRKRFGAPKLNSLSSLGSLSNLNIDDGKLDDSNVRKDSKYEFKNEDLQLICQLGAGAGGTVSKVLHAPTGLMMARKVNTIN